MAGQPEKQSSSSNKTVIVLLIVLIILVIVAIGVFVFVSSRKQDTQMEGQEKRNVLVSEENVDEVVEDLKEQAEKEEIIPSSYNATMNTVWHFKTGKEASYDAIVENSTQNSNAVYFDVVLSEDESKVIYKSPIIPVGEKITEFPLDVELSAGTYDCVVIYHLVDDNQNSLSTVRVSIQIIIEG